LGALAAAAAGGVIPVAQFDSAMRQAVKDAQGVNAAVGKGGVANLSESNAAFLAAVLAFQLDRLDRFTEELERGEARGGAGGKAGVVLVPPGTAAVRAAAYAKSAISSFDGMRRHVAEIAGYTMERNILGRAEHCRPGRNQTRPDCPSLSALGWQALGSIAPIGSRICLWNCRCHVEFGW
jgi:hypothetical protein